MAAAGAGDGNTNAWICRVQFSPASVRSDRRTSNTQRCVCGVLVDHTRAWSFGGEKVGKGGKYRPVMFPVFICFLPPNSLMFDNYSIVPLAAVQGSVLSPKLPLGGGKKGTVEK